MVDGGTTNYDSNCLNQYTKVGDVNYSYDKNGNLTDINDGEYEYIYDCENRLIEAKENSQTVATYAYDFAGRSLFGNHSFARLGSDIFDASVGKVDVDGDPDGAPHTARNLDGDDTWTNDYKDRVIDDNPPSSPTSPTNYSFTVY